jgi:hypothetical protein
MIGRLVVTSMKRRKGKGGREGGRRNFFMKKIRTLTIMCNIYV